jgi:hypothetical protein
LPEDTRIDAVIGSGQSVVPKPRVIPEELLESSEGERDLYTWHEPIPEDDTSDLLIGLTDAMFDRRQTQSHMTGVSTGRRALAEEILELIRTESSKELIVSGGRLTLKFDAEKVLGTVVQSLQDRNKR